MSLKSLFPAVSCSRRSQRPSSSRKIKAFRPTFEPLEQRMLLSITMAQWSTQDIVYTTTDPSSNWYTDSRQLQVTFAPPSGSGLSPIVVRAFWDGGSTFIARFTPTTTGTWTYTTAGSTIANLTNQTEASGSQIVVGAALAGDHGVLRVDPAYPNSFVYDDGTRYFMMGQTYYDWIGSAMQNDNWKTSVVNSKAAGFTKIRFDVYMGGLNNHPEDVTLYPDVQPYAGTSTSPNRDQLNLATTSFDGLTYFQKLDEMVQFMADNGMVADLIVTNPYYHMRMFGTDAQNNRFVQYVVDRYAAYTNVTWCLCNEWKKMTYWSYSPSYAYSLLTKDDFNTMGDIVHDNDPWGEDSRPLSIHNMQMDFEFFDANWPTHVVIQYGDANRDDRGANASIVANLGHNMPVVNDEFGYIGSLTREQERQSLWGIAAAGGYGSTADYRTYEMGVPENTGDWYDEPEYDDIKNLVDFFTIRGIEYWKMTSHDELKSGSSRDYLLAEPGRQYVLYTAVGDSAAGINLSDYSGYFNVVKFDPTNGTMTNLGPVAGGATRTWNLTGTNSAGGADWVLLVTRLDVLGVVPAVPSSLVATTVSTSRIDLNWTDNSSTETGFEIDLATNSSFTSGLTTFTVGANITTYQSTGLTYGTTYYYRVRATIGGTNDSGNSNVASATAGVFPPDSPTGLGATAASATQINLSWTDNSTTETGFEIDRALDSAFASGVTTVTVGANVTTYQSTGLSGSTTYYYRVRATIDGNNDSTNSNTASATTHTPPVQLLSDYTFDTSDGGQIAAGARPAALPSIRPLAEAPVRR